MSVVLLEGNIALISLFNLLQFVKLEQKTCAMDIEITILNQKARMFFNAGQLCYSEVNMLRGPEAMYRIICWWNTGQFKIYEADLEDLPEANIEVPLESILLESARYMDECATFRNTVTSLKSGLTFSDPAVAAIQDGKLPDFVKDLPRSFNIARYFDISPYSHWDACEFLKEMLKAKGLIVGGDDLRSTKDLTPIDSLHMIVMEYIGIGDSKALVQAALTELEFTADQTLGFSQLLSLADYLTEKIAIQLGDEEKAQEALYRLRARITSLV